MHKKTGVIFTRDVRIHMRDGVDFMANVFRPVVDRPCPVVMSVTPYGKDVLPDWIHMTLMRLTGVRFGHLACSKWTGFEAPDPLFWVRAGYAVVQADARGMHKSEGSASVLSDRDAQDYYELIEWAAGQSWSTGAVGLLGVSYLAMSQWRVAALRPPSLLAICPWEGVTDLLRELGYQDGVPETGFVGVWWRFRMEPGHNKRFPMNENFPEDRDRHPLDCEISDKATSRLLDPRESAHRHHHDQTRPGLFAPVEVLLAEDEDGAGCSVTYVCPSSLTR